MRFSIYLIICMVSLHTYANLHAIDIARSPNNGPTQSGIEQIVTIDHECRYPFNPSSIVTIIIFKKKGMNYIATGEKRCAWHFAKEIETVISDSIFVPKFYKNKLLKEIQVAKNRQKSI